MLLLTSHVSLSSLLRTLFPLIIFATFVSSGILLTYGKNPYLKGYFQSNEVYYGAGGLAVFIISMGMLFTLIRWMVLKITVLVTPDKLIVVKQGVYRTSRFEFSSPNSSVHYFRTHFSEDKAWLCLVIKEHDKFYKMCSWRGKGNQKERFMTFFNQITDALEHALEYRQTFSKDHTMHIVQIMEREGGREREGDVVLSSFL
eukprot:TRINITY_DN3224_c0_g1_i14.p1 TRINITY_DN3224_c0_g1~~TRINITY_DN3224_c0_g1_i14.p1  ORF type:complete len:201 (-),score=23.33 TRINITY_DN3224_c0_g1_i14:268-870(-)